MGPLCQLFYSAVWFIHTCTKHLPGKLSTSCQRSSNKLKTNSNRFHSAIFTTLKFSRAHSFKSVCSKLSLFHLQSLEISSRSLMRAWSRPIKRRRVVCHLILMQSSIVVQIIYDEHSSTTVIGVTLSSAKNSVVQITIVVYVYCLLSCVDHFIIAIFFLGFTTTNYYYYYYSRLYAFGSCVCSNNSPVVLTLANKHTVKRWHTGPKLNKKKQKKGRLSRLCHPNSCSSSLLLLLHT